MLQLYGHYVFLAVDFYGCLYRVAVLGQVPLLVLFLYFALSVLV